jgi:Alginate export
MRRQPCNRQINDATSGDRDPNDQRLQTFNPLFPGTAYSDTIGLIGAANSLALNPNLRFAAKERLIRVMSVMPQWAPIAPKNRRALGTSVSDSEEAPNRMIMSETCQRRLC